MLKKFCEFSSKDLDYLARDRFLLSYGFKISRNIKIKYLFHLDQVFIDLTNFIQAVSEPLSMKIW